MKDDFEDPTYFIEMEGRNPRVQEVILNLAAGRIVLGVVRPALMVKYRKAE